MPLDLRRYTSARRLQSYGVALLGIAATTALLLPFRAHLNTLNLALLYLIVVTMLSLSLGTLPSIMASVLAFLCFDFFFIPPFYTFTVARLDHVLTLFVFLGIAILVTQLVVRVRAQHAEVLRRARQTAILYSLSTALIGEATLDAMLEAIVKRLRQVFALESCAILLWVNDAFQTRAQEGAPAVSLTNPNLLNLARWVLEKRQVAGISSVRAKVVPPSSPEHGRLWNFAQGFRGRDALVVPIATANRPLGVLVVGRGRHPALDEEEQQLLATFANQAALAIERSLLAEEHLRAELLARSDELKSALLSAVSHDLRTPLAAIKASATSLLQTDVSWTEEDRRDLLEAIDEEADRLNRFVANILDLTRIEAGALKPERDWYSLREIILSAVDRSATMLRQNPLRLDLPSELPTLFVDFIEIEQVLMNLLENAAKYSAPGSPITISAMLGEHAVELAVHDEGIGIPPGEEQRIFDKFYRVENPQRPIGSGVGLAISRGFVEAHGGRIWAERDPARGLTIRLQLPLMPDPLAEPSRPVAPVAMEATGI